MFDYFTATQLQCLSCPVLSVFSTSRLMLTTKYHRPYWTW